MLLNALHFYMVKTIHLFIILTSGIHCVSAVSGEGERYSGQSPRRSASLRLLVPSAPLCLLPGLLCVGLSGLETPACEKTGELDNEILAEGTMN